MHSVEGYLKTLAEIHSTGGSTAETSFYSALETLLNEVGAKLKPKVRAVAQLVNTGAGSPDFGLYSASQFQRFKDDKPIEGVAPERGVVEVKGWKDDSFVTSESNQVSKYWKHYGLILVTNYRDFVLIGRDAAGQPLRLETCRMADSEAGFRGLMAHPRKAAEEQGERLLEFLRRVMLYITVLADPEDLAWFLASYAREARYRIEAAGNLVALDGLRRALEESLGMTFEGEKGIRFFKATLVQTLFYGIFSSWVLWSRDHWGQPDARFNWHEAGWTLHVPMVASLFNQIATPQKLKPLSIDEVLDWAGAALNRVDRSAFFAKFEEDHAVQYFYEPFLKAYDPELRKELGVWYTPPEIVQYQVERVDRVLRVELDIADGLADDRVVVLDPCCGTGAYLVETLKRIHKTLEEKGGSALTAQRLKRAAIERVYGFEILPAPFVVAHLQLGLMLRQLNAPLDHDSNQRAGVYLTNALTGWEPLEKPKNELPLFPELMEEREAANRVKQEAPILVIIGNPPYNAFTGTSPQEEGGLVDAYKDGLSDWGITKNYLDDLYVRFFRIAERRIGQTGIGVVCYISNFSYLGDPSFVVMRQHILDEFDKLWFDCLNGDSRETGKQTPDGKPDPSVFSTEQNSVGIRVGTAIGLMVRKTKRLRKPTVRFRHYWGVTKRRDILASLGLKHLDRKYETANPTPENKFSFRPMNVSECYMGWPRITDIADIKPMLGLNENRQGALQDITKKSLVNRIHEYLDPAITDELFFAKYENFGTHKAGYVPRDVRQKTISKESFCASRVWPYLTRPLDARWAYVSDVSPLWNRSRPELRQYFKCQNGFLVSRPSCPASPEGFPMLYTQQLGEQDLIRGHAYYFPFRLYREAEKLRGKFGQEDMFGHEATKISVTANLSESTRIYLAELGFVDPDSNIETAGLIWMHALAIGYSPAYLEENADGIRKNWPRIPLPSKKKVLLDSADMGRRVAVVLNAETTVEGVTCGEIDPRLKSLGVIRKTGGGALDPDAGELGLVAGWGHSGARGVCMPGRGRTKERNTTVREQIACFGEATLDVYLNDVAYWENVPSAVWNHTIGGYQVIKKWLSYREKAILGRGLTLEEAEYVTEMVRRIAAIILMRADLDNNYANTKADTWPWPEK